MNKVKVNVNGEAILSRVTRMFDNSPESILLEIAQNARRAGAKKIYVDFSDDNKLVVLHDGRPFSEEDFTALFSLGDSGWDDEDTLAEDPAGSGFFISALFDKTVIYSYNREEGYADMIEATKEQLSSAGSELNIERPVTMPGCGAAYNVRIELHGEHRVCYNAYVDVAKHFPIDIIGYGRRGLLPEEPCREHSIKSCLILAEERKDMAVYDKVMHGVRFMLFTNCSDAFRTEVGNVYGSSFSSYFSSQRYKASPLYFNFHGHHAKLCGADPDVADILYRCGDDVSVMMVIPGEDSNIRMVLPARHSIVENEAYRTMLDDMKIATREYVKSLGNHTLPYALYEHIGGPDHIKKEADIPNKLINADDGTLVLRGPVSEPGIDMLLFYEESNLNRPVIEIPGIDNYKGYSWYDNYSIVKPDQIELLVGGFSQSEFPESGTVKSIELIYTDESGDSEQLGEYDYGFSTDYGETLAGPCLTDISMWATSNAKPSEAINGISSYIMDVWEASVDYENDSAYTQKIEFEEELMAELYRVFDPDNVLLNDIKTFIDSNMWKLNKILEIDFITDSGESVHIDMTKRYEEGFITINKK